MQEERSITCSWHNLSRTRTTFWAVRSMFYAGFEFSTRRLVNQPRLSLCSPRPLLLGVPRCCCLPPRARPRPLKCSSPLCLWCTCTPYRIRTRIRVCTTAPSTRSRDARIWRTSPWSLCARRRIRITGSCEAWRHCVISSRAGRTDGRTHRRPALICCRCCWWQWWSAV